MTTEIRSQHGRSQADADPRRALPIQASRSSREPSDARLRILIAALVFAFVACTACATTSDAQAEPPSTATAEAQPEAIGESSTAETGMAPAARTAPEHDPLMAGADLVARADGADLVAEEPLPATVTEVFQANEPQVRFCQKRVERNFGPLRGRLRLAIVIDGNGRVERIDVLENEANDKIVDCFRSVITNWRFPPSATTVDRLWIFA